MKTYYIGADVHSNSTELAVEHNGTIISRYSVPTSVTAIKKVLTSINGKKYLTFEEGPMAGWLYRNLKDSFEQVIVCDPRRNKLIASDGDSDDHIDAAKLASLLRGKYLRSVYHSDDDNRALLKEWVNLYHDRVHDAVRMINKIRARCRMNGLSIPRIVIRDPTRRKLWLCGIGNKSLSSQLNMLWLSFDAIIAQVKESRKKLALLSRPYPIIKQWSQLAGIGTIRAVTLFAYLDTPFRFAHKNKLWKYCGVGLQRSASGTDNKGRPKPARLQLAWAANRMLKNVCLGAALTAMHQRDNIFRSDYERMIHEGITPSNARHAVARKMLTVMWGMWKANSNFSRDKAMPNLKTNASLV